jgi:chaperonin GroES
MKRSVACHSDRRPGIPVLKLAGLAHTVSERQQRNLFHGNMLCDPWLAGTKVAILLGSPDSQTVHSPIDPQETAMGLKPIGDRIVVRRSKAEESTKGGILLPDTAKNKPQKGKVMAVGPGRIGKDGKRRALQVKPGDTILFTAWAGDEFNEKGSSDSILVMREEDVMAVVDE